MPKPKVASAKSPAVAKKTLAKPVKAPKVPKDFAACADRLMALTKERSVVQKSLDALETERKAIEKYVIDTMPKSMKGVLGKTAKLELKKKHRPNVVDWDKFRAYIVKQKAWDLLRKQTLDSALDERWEAGVKIPGVEKFHYVKVSITKV